MFRYVTLTSIIALSFFQQNVAMASGNFTRTCSGIELINGSFLKANCRTNKGQTVQTSVQLNNHIENINGALRWRRNANYIATSTNCELDSVSGVTVLDCDSQKRNGSWTSSSLNLDERIANIDGQLTYE